jgi:glucose-1-phosphate adenylyltransferase
MAHTKHVDHQQIAKETLVIILAGGQGSRLHELTKSRAKPALEFGGGFRIIDFPLSNCVNSGFKKIGVVTQYKAQCLIRHLVSTWSKFNQNFGEFLELLPASQQHSDEWYKGTADSLYQNIEFIKSTMPKYVLVLSGDHIYKMDYRGMMETHIMSGAPMTVSCIEAPLQQAAGQFGVVNIDALNMVTSFEEKPMTPRGLPDKPSHVLASMGNYVFDTDFLIEQLQQDALDYNSSHDFGKDLIPKLLASHKMQTHRFYSDDGMSTPYWRDVGTLDAYWEANLALLKDRPAIDLCDQYWPIWSSTTYLQPAKFMSNNEMKSGYVNNSLIAAACIVYSSSISDSLLFEHVTVKANAHITKSVLLPTVQVGKNVTIHKAIIDCNCVIPDNFEIGVDQEEDINRGFRISLGGVVLVTQAMLQNLLQNKPKHHHSARKHNYNGVTQDQNHALLKPKMLETKMWT